MTEKIQFEFERQVLMTDPVNITQNSRSMDEWTLVTAAKSLDRPIFWTEFLRVPK